MALLLLAQVESKLQQNAPSLLSLSDNETGS